MGFSKRANDLGTTLPTTLAVLGAMLLLLKGFALIALLGCGAEDEAGGWWSVLWGGASLAGAALALGSVNALAKRSFREGAAWLAIAILVTVAPELAIVAIGVVGGEARDLPSGWMVFVLLADVGVLPLALAALIALRRSRLARG